MNAIVEPLQSLDSFRAVAEGVAGCRTPVLATGVIDSQKCHLAYALQHTLNRQALIITHSELHAREIAEDMRFFLHERALLYPSRDVSFYHADVRSAQISRARLDVLNAFVTGEAAVCVLSVEALFDKIAPRESFEASILTVEAGGQLPLTEFVAELVARGYERAELVEGPGQFAVRGGVVDVYTPVFDNAVRVEYWGDEIDSVRLLDVYSQRSVENMKSAKIYPRTERWNESGGASLFDYLSPDAIVFLDEPRRVADHAGAASQAIHESMKSRMEKGAPLTDGESAVFSYGDVLSFVHRFPVVLFTMMTQRVDDFKPKEIVSFTVKASGAAHRRFDLLAEDLRYYCQNGFRTLVLSGSPARGQRLAEELLAAGLSASYTENAEGATLAPGAVTVAHGSMNSGFEYGHINLAVVTDKALFGEEKKRKRRAKKKTGSRIESFTDLKTGDYIVHDNHGVGVYMGLTQIVTDGVGKDYMKLQYADGGNLYVHTSQMDMIQKYIGGDGVKLRLNKLGGGDWAKLKAKTKKAVRELAKELVDLYARRQAARGFAFSKDAVWQKEFEELFPFEETDDQLAAIADVKADMESSRVMDRLICGDVGYGKTEVALRAAFKAVQDGKQVAYLVPTTILAQQHYNTFTQRMKDFPLEIEMLSRFRSKKQQAESVAKLSSGRADIVIGTHRLLSKDISFKDLGLIIVDEEQRFGVSHKEKLKRMKAEVDVMTLTATPIPRTLHMSLTGIRDMSLLEEPPQERQPVQTYVMEYSAELVKEAVVRELARDGQVYYLHNRVRNIMDVASKLAALVPQASVAFAHGQMSERELENIMVDFINGDIDVLVCTTIIETGLDISNVNTIIIQDADYMGLSQLYQLRGRVGRASRQAYAYLMYRRDKVLEETAEKRLQTIREFTEFGSGFRIAMRDMEIRGAGNLLGGEQHGHMDAVGYEMYCRLLDEVIREMKNETLPEPFETTIDMNIDACIPEYYIENEEQKLEIYKKISLIRTERDYYDVRDEIEDRFGGITPSVKNLLDIALLKSCAHNLDIAAVAHKGGALVMTFRPDAKANPESIMRVVVENSAKISFSAGLTPCLTYRAPGNGGAIDLWDVKALLEKMC